MKNILKAICISVIMGVCCVAVLSCSKEESRPDISGEWHLVSTGELPMDGIDIYAVFGNGSFSLYQKTGDMLQYYQYTGHYSVSGDILSGTYTDGTPFGSTYRITMMENDSVLVLTAQNGSGESSRYGKTPVPGSVKNSVVVTRAGEAGCDGISPFL